MLTKLCYHHRYSPSICALTFFVGLVRVAPVHLTFVACSDGTINEMGGEEKSLRFT